MKFQWPLPYGTVVRDPKDGETLMITYGVDHAGYINVHHVLLDFPGEDDTPGETGNYSFDWMNSQGYKVIE